MSRRNRAEVREVLPDPKYKDIVLTKLMNAVMEDGKKFVAERIVYGALEVISKSDRATKIAANLPAETKAGLPMELRVFYAALENLKPALEVRSRRVGGATYQVPTEVRPSRRQALALRWLINAARARNESETKLRLANEILDAAEGKGASVKKKEDTQKMADANKAFAHFKW